ncbi:DUF1453 family protein [Streptomyces corynorhini]|uniref:DUF1453 family protein n=1 Tax=Streptomyces corynorhini TaxID=2282652 RepID=A0A370BEJ0_9ACTN|nr:DUF1453 family protein [Streptomyces corynorhini]RDG40071.1 DUF1453 family protein [Streptomyces corynorhini]
MSLVNLLVIVAVVALVVARQIKPQRIRTGGRKWLVAPVVLAAMALREPRLLDPHHTAVAALLIGVELAVGVLIGVGWARTSRVWTGQDGAVWSKGTRATAAVWGVGIAVRLGLMGVGVMLGVHQGSGALLLALAATLLVRGGLLARRAQALRPSGGPAPSYGDHVATAPWKDRV